MKRQSKVTSIDDRAENACESDMTAPLADAPCFIETQFPVAKVSMESYKERKAGASQTLTGLGKWWGRKPLVLVRSAILGLLMPSSNDPERDREIFLRIMTMDDEGLWRRKNKSIAGKRLIEELHLMPPSVQDRYLEPDAPTDKPSIRRLSREEREQLQHLVFERMPYSEQLQYCQRPEQIDGPSSEAWSEINTYLGTDAHNLTQLIQELGQRKFGRHPRIGDSFCGAGSVPFEAARLGCDAYAFDLSPVGTLLTWAGINIIGGRQDLSAKLRELRESIYDDVASQIAEWGLEQNEEGWVADAYLYCAETIDPESGWAVPLAPSWVIAEKTNVIAKLKADESRRRYDIEIIERATREDYDAARHGTVSDNRLRPPGNMASTPLDVVRRHMRQWAKEDVAPRPDDVYQERLYCIRWVETYHDTNSRGEPIERIRRHYCAPTAEDMDCEYRVGELLRERFKGWQNKGYIPSRQIEPGYNTTQPIRERGWTYWHHLFTPRQLLINGLLWETAIERRNLTSAEMVQVALSLGACADWNSKLCRWISSVHHSGGIGSLAQTFYNQALNTLLNHGIRPTTVLRSTFCNDIPSSPVHGKSAVKPCDAREVAEECDIWITDPPYADAVNYHELGEFFLAWYNKHVIHLFPDWYDDSKRALAVRGNDVNFRQSMVECYRRLTEHMPANGMQVVMFTHQDASVWADLTMILWAAGLHVTAAWCIATETAVGIKSGNYVQGTVLLICRKRSDQDTVFLDEISHRVEGEVRRQLDNMLALEDDSDPNFADADYQLAAYAAALRVLTERPIEEIDPAREILRERSPGEIGPVERLIRNAVKIACDHLVPDAIDRDMWKTLAPMERFYLKGLEVETHGEHRSGVYQELARGFGATDYTNLLQSDRANQTRLKTAREFESRMLSGEGFAGSLTRQCLFAVYQVTQNEQVADGLDWLKTELSDYWTLRDKTLHILDFLGRIDRVSGMDHWNKDSESARLLGGMVRNDHI